MRRIGNRPLPFFLGFAGAKIKGAFSRQTKAVASAKHLFLLQRLR